MDDVTGEHGIPVLIPPESGKRNGEARLDRRALRMDARCA